MSRRNLKFDVSPITSRFQDAETENVYQDFVLERTMRFDRIALGLGAFVYFSYGVLDLITLTYGILAFSLRMLGVVVILGFVGIFQSKKVARHFENITTVLVIMTGLLINLVMMLEGNYHNEYYVGLIHVMIFSAVLLRTGVLNGGIVALSMLVGFIFSWSSFAPEGAILTPLFFLIGTFMTCIAGMHIIERIRRMDFQKYVQTELYSEKVQVALKQEALRVEQMENIFRIFGHYIKTPIHQIIGNGDLAKFASENVPEQEELLDSSVQEIQTAAHSLLRFTTRIMDYHRIDEISPATFKECSISMALDNAIYMLQEKFDVQNTVETVCVLGEINLLSSALDELAQNIIDFAVPESTVLVNAYEENEDVIIEFQSTLATAFDPAHFERNRIPVEKSVDYLSEGHKLALGVRIADKSVDKMGGEIKFVVKDDNLVCTIRLPAYRAEVDLTTRESA